MANLWHVPQAAGTTALLVVWQGGESEAIDRMGKEIKVLLREGAGFTLWHSDQKRVGPLLL